MGKSKKSKTDEPTAPIVEMSSAKPANVEVDAGKSAKKGKSFGGSGESIEDALKGIKKILMDLPEKPSLSLDDVLKWSKETGVSIPWPANQGPSDSFIKNSSSSSSSSIKFQVCRPQSIAIAGSFMLQTSLTDGEGNVDVIVEMPDGLIFRYDSEKDHLNWRYWLRRAVFLAHCAEALKKSAVDSKHVKLEYELLNDNPWKTILVIRIEGLNKCIRIVPSVPFTDGFKAKLFRMSPARNNVRPQFISEWKGESIAEIKESDLPATPYYNASLLSEATYLPHLLFLHQMISANPTYISATKFLKAFLKQQQANQAGGCIDGFLATMWLASMIKSGRIDATVMDEIQIFKSVLTSWIEEFGKVNVESGYFNNQSIASIEGFSSEDWKKGGEKVVFVDSITEALNLFYQVSPTGLCTLVRASKNTLKFLEQNPDRLDRVLLENAVPSRDLFTFDSVIKVDCVDSETLTAPVYRLLPTLLDSAQPILAGKLRDRIAAVLTKGLNDRLKGPVTVRLTCTSGNRWDIKTFKSQPLEFNVFIGVILDPINSLRLVDLGPLADDKAAVAKFRGFWGEKSELRQFKDGSIRECLVWESLAGNRRHLIPIEIVKFLLKRHFPGLASSVSVKTTSTGLDFVQEEIDAGIKSGALFVNFSAAFDLLMRELRTLSSTTLPLSIVHCAGISEAHRHSSIIPPKPIERLAFEYPSANLPDQFTPVHDFLIQFESSSDWPDELQALRYAKEAFLVHLHKKIMKLSHQADSEFKATSMVGRDFIDIFFKGFIFRGWIDVPKEISRCRLEGLQDEAALLENRLWWLPKLTDSLHRLANRNPVYSSSVRVLKRFASSHLFTELDLPTEFLEAVTAAAFLPTEASMMKSGTADSIISLLSEAPAGTFAAFLRVLDLIASFPWFERPFILDLSTLDADDEEIKNSMGKQTIDWSHLMHSKQNPVHVVTLFTQEHKAAVSAALLSDSSIQSLVPAAPWTRSLSRSTLIRLRLLCKVALELIHTSAKDSSLEGKSLAGLFQEDLEADYDILITLDANQLILPVQSKHHDRTQILGMAKVLRNAPQPSPLLFSTLQAFNPAHNLLNDLNSELSTSVTFFADQITGSVIAARFKNSKITGSEKEALLGRIKSMGGDLIDSVRLTNSS